MSDAVKVATDGEEQLILVHGPLTGDTKRITAAQQNDAELEAPLQLRPVPENIRDPLTRQTILNGVTPSGRSRVFGLDAVRGLSLLAMNFTFALPYVKFMPAWMYHMQEPPPLGAYVAQAGLTWQDIIFPGFLFAMAAAIPIRNSQLLAAGEPGPKVAWGSIQRASLLYVFSLIIAHVNPFYTKVYTTQGNLMAIAGFITCFALFVRRRSDWNERTFAWVRRAGWLGAAIILFLLPFTWNAVFSPTRRDNIITSIAFSYAIGSIIWLLTRRSIARRLALMGAIALLKLLVTVSPLVAAMWGWTPLPWVYEPWYFELLLLVIPGTIAGDLLVRWSRQSAPEVEQPERLAEVSLSNARLRVVALLGMLTPIVLLVGLYQRHVTATMLGLFAVIAIGAFMLRGARTERDRLLARMGAWTAVLLILGILLEPLEGGIKKDPQTISFLLLCGGLWFGVLLSSTILIDIIGGAARRLMDPIILAGQNAMLAYVVFMLFLSHIAYYLHFGDVLTATPGQAIVRCVIVTTVVLTMMAAATRNRIVWRS